MPVLNMANKNNILIFPVILPLAKCYFDFSLGFTNIFETSPNSCNWPKALQ